MNGRTIRCPCRFWPSSTRGPDSHFETNDCGRYAISFHEADWLSFVVLLLLPDTYFVSVTDPTLNTIKALKHSSCNQIYFRFRLLRKLFALCNLASLRFSRIFLTVRIPPASVFGDLPSFGSNNPPAQYAKRTKRAIVSRLIPTGLR